VSDPRAAQLTLDVITIFPDYLAPLHQSLLGKAIQRGQVIARVHDLRRWTDDIHRTVDDSPYGGGPGMVMRPEPWGRALDEIVGPGNEAADAVSPLLAAPPLLIVPTPTGVRFTQQIAHRLAARPWLVFACGRYEGIDARVTEHAAARMDVLELSVGDYVLSGGEAAVLVIAEAVTRLLPGVLGNAASAVEDSFADGLLEGPAYTKPPTWRGLDVPAVLRSGDHGAIARWRHEQSLLRTRSRRPDLTPPTT
jgi:tRNA (guanine37-N1)-methyltransferase